MVSFSSLTQRAFFNISASFGWRLARAWMPYYPYMFTPAQLAFLISCLDRTRDVSGKILEVGCMRGRTTVYLNQHMDTEGIEKPYVCIDTFAGFTKRDVAYEIRARGKDPKFDWAGFSNNKRSWFDKGMQLNGISRVSSIKADVVEYDFGCIQDQPVAFCLIDVDLYQPVRTALDRVYPRLAAGGMIVIDDCQAGGAYDGALDAYRDFIREHALKETIVCQMGVIN